MESNNRLQHITDCLVEFRKLWLIPAIAGLLLATVYAFVLKSDSWTARQTMIMRDDLLGQQFKPGTFVSQEALKSAQETVLETARRPEVIKRVLDELGPDSGFLGLSSPGANWPSKETIEDTRSAVSFESANGGEVGKSEVIVLATKASSPERATKFLALLLEQVDQKLSEIQADRFESMEAELRATCESALRTRERLEQKVKDLDANLGTDLLALKSFKDEGGSPSAFETKLNEIEQDRRKAERKLAELRSQKRLLTEARNSSANELPSSSELLANQPTLANKYESLSKARQKLSEMEGKYTQAHPAVEDAQRQVAAVIGQIKDSLGTVDRGLDGQIKVQQDTIALLDSKLQESNDTLLRVSRHRAGYETATKELNKQNEDYSEASARLARVQSRKLASDSIKLLTRVGTPSAGTRPDGLGKKALSLIGGIAGLMIGLGLVMIVAPPYEEQFLPASQTRETPEIDGSQMLDNYLAEHRRRPDAGNESAQPQPTQPVTPTPPPAPAPAAAAPVAPAVSNPVPNPTPATPASFQETVNAVLGTESTQAPVASPPAPSETVVSSSVPAPVVPQPIQPIVPQTASEPVSAEPAPLEPTPRVVPPPTSIETPTIAGMQVPAATQPPVDMTPQAPVSTPEVTSEPEQLSDPTPTIQIPSPSLPPVVQIPGNALGPNQPANSDTESESTSPNEPQYQQPPSVSTPPKTLAAIFANMPQPRTDIVVDTGQGSSTGSDPSEDSSPTARDEAQTIQLPGDSIAGADDSLAIQRRASYRPVDLAKNLDLDADIDGEQTSKSQSIDSVFSELKPTRRRPDQDQPPQLP